LIFGNPRKTKEKGIDQILASACCPRQYVHIDVKKVAYNHVTAILQQCQEDHNYVVLLLFFFVTVFISTRFYDGGRLLLVAVIGVDNVRRPSD